MRLAFQVSVRSRDPNTQHGCVLADANHRVVSTGYNGPPAGIDDSLVVWSRPEKYDWVVHAEQNALLHCPDLSRVAAAYVTGLPCKRCLLLLRAAGVREVHYGPTASAMVAEAEVLEFAAKLKVRLLPCS